MQFSHSLKILTGTSFSLLAMLPIWPVEGLWFGIPAWAVTVVVGSALSGLWIAYVSLKCWPGENDD